MNQPEGTRFLVESPSFYGKGTEMTEYKQSLGVRPENSGSHHFVIGGDSR